MKTITADEKLLSYLSPKVKIGQSFHGKGLFARERIEPGEVIIDFTNGLGKYIPTKEADKLYEQGNDYMIQVDDDLFFAASTEEEVEDTDFVNHSCNPNCGIKGSLQIVTRRPIQPQEEITIDYALCDLSYKLFFTKCNSASAAFLLSSRSIATSCFSCS